MSDFPRGWTLTNDNGASGSVAAVVTAAATPGVAHVLDGFAAILVNNTATATAPVVTLSSSDGAFAGYVISRISAGPNSAGSDSESGLDLAAGPGASLTIAFNTPVSGAIEFLRVRGHDI